jgi:hypothetical protein
VKQDDRFAIFWPADKNMRESVTGFDVVFGKFDFPQPQCVIVGAKVKQFSGFGRKYKVVRVFGDGAGAKQPDGKQQYKCLSHGELVRFPKLTV